ncbi:hypothetical protein HanIR_Chr10g0481061 [Helianthus annuus]|nr:hypothetical protein HanIR_Chr10g0481061 [Helianthus annuus]
MACITNGINPSIYFFLMLVCEDGKLVDMNVFGWLCYVTSCLRSIYKGRVNIRLTLRCRIVKMLRLTLWIGCCL